jgi:hypothetical protein
MNTLKKGNDFEEKALRIIEKTLKEVQLGLMKDQVRIYKKKNYSLERSNPI